MNMNKKLKLYLDDVRIPNDPEWIVVKNYDEFVAQIRLNGLENFDVISLDHDLGEDAMTEYYTNVQNNYNLNYDNIKEKTGLDCCKFLVEYSMTNEVPLPLVYVHSANPIGSHNMMGYINNYLKNSGLPQNCIRVKISHTISPTFEMTPEMRKLRWDKSSK